MNENIYIKNYEDRVNTTETYLENSFEQFGCISNDQSYKNLEFRHRTLQHEYAVLENQFQLYSSETFARISSLEKDMDMLVEEKDRAIKTISLENKNLKQESTRLQGQIISLQSQIEKVIRKCKACESQLKNVVFTNQKSEMKQRQIVLDFERQLSIKIEQVQNLKDILNNERMAVLSKDQLLINKDNQIAELVAELKSLSIELDSQRQIEDSIKDSNYKLKRQVEDLKSMFTQMEVQLRNCQKCRSLQLKNMELMSIVKELRQKSRIMQKQNRKEYSYSISRTNKRTIDPHRTIDINKTYDHRTIDYNRAATENFNFSNKGSFGGRKYLGDITVDDIRPTNDFFPVRNMKDSVIRRCKIALDKN